MKNVNKENLLKMLIVFELVLSILFVISGHFMDNIYIRGVGVGLIIAWVTSTIAYLIAGKKQGV